MVLSNKNLLRHPPFVIAVFLFAAAVLSSCHRKVDEEQADKPPPEQSGFSLSIPESRWQASKFCGDVTPATPEDPTPEHRFETDLLKEKLLGPGLKGWIHGAVPLYDQYVFTYRKEDPSDFMAFFKAQQFSLIPADQEIAKILASLKRHDQVVLKGQVFENGSPMVHLRVSGIEVVKKYSLATENSYQSDVTKLRDKNEFDVFGMVHAIVHSDKLGYAIMVENRDIILPVAIGPKHNSEAAKLYRGDIINVGISVVARKSGPPHFTTNGNRDSAMTIVDPILNCHGLDRTVEGTLVKFEKSPAISVDVYAVRVVDANGIGRNFTFFPASQDDATFSDVFMGISAKAKAAWDGGGGDASVIRNFREKARIRVVAKGRLNVVSLEQANAQIYINSLEDVVFDVQP